MSYITIVKFFLLLTAIPQQTMQAATPLSPASISGTVMRAGSAPPAPVARARVVLSSLPRGDAETKLITVLTDDAGRFAIKDIPPGTYDFMATRDGFVKAAKTLSLAPRDAVTNSVVEMIPTGAIAGHLRDKFGNPLSNAVVQAQRFSYRDGRRALANVQKTFTNDLGEFRLFFLPPGQYVVSAMANSGPAATAGSTDSSTLLARALPGVPVIGQLLGGRDEPGQGMVRASLTDFLSAGILPASMSHSAPALVYFPGTFDVSGAVAIDLAPGSDFRNADFTVGEARPGRIRGRVVNGATGLPAIGARVMLISKEDTGDLLPARLLATLKADGTFEFAGVPPGSYDLATLVGTLPPGMSSGGVGYPGGAGINPFPQRNVRDYSSDTSGLRLGARIPLQIADNDLEDIVLTASVGYTIKGRLVIEGASVDESQRQVNGIVVQLKPTSQDFETAAIPTPVRPDGTFTIVGALPGTYQIWLMGASNLRDGVVSENYVKSATLGTVDVINPRFVIDKEPVGELEIVVSAAMGGVAAAVLDGKGSPVSGATVVLIPDIAHRQHYDMYASEQSQADGIAGLGARPGDYIAYAFERIETNSWWDPTFMQKYAGQGTAVHVDEGKVAPVELKIIR